MSVEKERPKENIEENIPQRLNFFLKKAIKK